MDNKQNEVITKKNRFPLWIIIATVIIIVAGTAGGIAVANAVNPTRKVVKQLELARKYVTELNYEQAIIAYEAAISIDPKNADAYIELAQVYIEVGELELAKEVLEKALENVEEDDIRRVEKEQKKLKDKSDEDTLIPTLTSEPTPEPTTAPTPTQVVYADVEINETGFPDENLETM